jgi:hypothetical protein
LCCCENKRIPEWLFEIYNHRNYQKIGYIKAHCKEEAEHISTLMFEYIFKEINGSKGILRLVPLWTDCSNENSGLYTKLSLDAIQAIEDNIEHTKENINKLEKEMRNYNVMKDFLSINMSTFNEG